MWLDEILTTIFFVVLLINIQEQHQSSEAEAAVHTQTHNIDNKETKERWTVIRWTQEDCGGLVSVRNESALTVTYWLSLTFLPCHTPCHSPASPVCHSNGYKYYRTRTVRKHSHDQDFWHYLYLFNTVKYFCSLCVIISISRERKGAGEVSGCCQTDKCLNQNPY